MCKEGVKKMRLNIGSGKEYRQDWLNIDVNEKFNPDIVMDMRSLMFPDESVDEILMQDVLDHVTFVEGKEVLRKCYGWLKNNGTLNIRTPNLSFIGREASKGNHEAIKWLYGSDGEGHTNYDSNIIRWCYSENSLRIIMEAIGFIVIDAHTENLEYSLRMIGVKRI